MRLIEFLGIPEMEAQLAKHGSHGGKRTGAGRPKQVDAPIRRTVYLDQSSVDIVIDYQAVYDVGFSNALRQILAKYRKVNTSKRHTDIP